MIKNIVLFTSIVTTYYLSFCSIVDVQSFFRIGALVGEGNGNELHAEGFANGEVAVVARGGAQPLHALQRAPGGIALGAEGPQSRNGVEHQGEAGAAAGDDVLRIVVEQAGEQLLGLGDAAQAAVVGAIGAVAAGEVGLFAQHFQHGARKVQLLGRGLPAGHVQLQALRFEALVSRVHCGQFGRNLLRGEAVVASHVRPFAATGALLPWST